MTPINHPPCFPLRGSYRDPQAYSKQVEWKPGMCTTGFAPRWCSQLTEARCSITSSGIVELLPALDVKEAPELAAQRPGTTPQRDCRGCMGDGGGGGGKISWRGMGGFPKCSDPKKASFSDPWFDCLLGSGVKGV